MTLLELLLVLAVLVALASLSWATFRGPMETHRLRRSADAVCAAWSDARVQAMSSGQTRTFRYLLEGDQYFIEAADPLSGGSQPAVDLGLSAGAEGAEAGAVGGAKLLPSDIYFVEGTTVADVRADDGLGAVDQLPAIRFFSDGTTDSAAVVLGTPGGKRIMVELRGLTATATVGGVYHEETAAR